MAAARRSLDRPPAHAWRVVGAIGGPAEHSFDHPDLTRALCNAGFDVGAIDALVAATGPLNGRGYGYTFSDLVQRLLPAVLLDAYPDRPLDPMRALDIARTILPSPPFEESKAVC